MLSPLSPTLTSLGQALLNAPAPFDPSQVANLLAWWKPDSLGLSNGASVNSWSDSSGNGNTLTPPGTATSPIYQTSAQNGVPGVKFNATKDGLASSLSLTEPFTIFVIEKPQSTTGNKRTLNSTTQNRLMSAGRSTGNSVYLGGNVSNFAVGDLLCHLHELKITTSGATYIVDGTDHTDGPTTHNPWANLALSWTPVNTESADTIVFDVIVYGAIPSSGDETSVINWLKTKYSI